MVSSTWMIIKDKSFFKMQEYNSIKYILFSIYIENYKFLYEKTNTLYIININKKELTNE